jgi:hypothetical protein
VESRPDAVLVTSETEVGFTETRLGPAGATLAGGVMTGAPVLGEVAVTGAEGTCGR